MKKIFDEQHPHEEAIYRTIWYSETSKELTQSLQKEICTQVEKDLLIPLEKGNYLTHWIFYFDERSEDALGEQVRSSLMIREQGGIYTLNYNMSDFEFVTQLEAVNSFKQELEIRLSEIKHLKNEVE